MTVELSLAVNGVTIRTDYFVQGFIDHTLSGMVEALEGTGKIRDLDLAIDEDEVTVNLNGAAVPVNTFASKIIKGTTVGMVSVLKGVKDTKKVNITLRK